MGIDKYLILPWLLYNKWNISNNTILGVNIWPDDNYNYSLVEYNIY